MKRPANSPFEVLKQSGEQFSEDNCPRLAAALSYYTVFSLPPLLVIILSVVGYFFDPEQIREFISQQTQGVLGAEQIQSFVEGARDSGQGGLASIIGILGLIIGATVVVVQLQDSMNTVWQVQPDKEHGGAKNLIMKRIVSFLLIVGVAFLLLASLVVTSMITSLGQTASENMGAGDYWGMIYQVINFLISIAIFTVLFAALFKILPDAKVEWSDVWTGALLSAILFAIGKLALGVYFGQFEPASAYGTAGSIALLLIWVYYTAMIFLFGAEFTQAWTRYRGHRIMPAEGAVHVVRITQPGTSLTTE